MDLDSSKSSRKGRTRWGPDVEVKSKTSRFSSATWQTTPAQPMDISPLNHSSASMWQAPPSVGNNLPKPIAAMPTQTAALDPKDKTVLGIYVKVSKSGKSYQCPLPGCEEYLKYEDVNEPKLHLKASHFPKALFTKYKDSKKHLDSLLVALAKQCGMKTTLKRAKGQHDLIKQLLNFVQMNDMHKCYSGCAITEDEKTVVHFYHQHNQHGLPLNLVNVHQPNCVAALVWWKNVLDILVTLDAKGVNAVLASDSDSSQQHATSKPVPAPAPTPAPVVATKQEHQQDSSQPFSARVPTGVKDGDEEDVIIVKEVKSKRGKEQTIVPGLPVTDGYCDHSSLKGSSYSEELAQRCSIVAFEDPTLFPDENFFASKCCGQHSYFSLGFSASLQKANTNPTLWKKIEKALTFPRVVAVGAVGLDYSLASDTKQAQVVGLTRMCTFAKERKLPLIVRCVERSHSLDANRDCVEILRGILTPEDFVVKLALSSFKEALLWYEAFPRTVFGIDSSVLTSDVMTSSFTSFVGLLDMNNMLIHSGGSATSRDGQTTAAELASEIGKKVGNLKNLTSKNVTHNQMLLMRRLFKIDVKA